MGIKILQLKVILDIIAREKERFSRPEDPLDETKSCPTSAPRSRKLKAPYIKVSEIFSLDTSVWLFEIRCCCLKNLRTVV